MKTKELNKISKQYILDCVDGTGYNKELTTNEEKLNFLYDTFKNEYSWAIDRLGPYKAFKEWIMGLPSSFNIEFSNYNILQLAKKWGSIPENATEKQENKILENYWNFITAKTFQLFNSYKII